MTQKPFVPRSAAGKYTPPEPAKAFGDSEQQNISGEREPTTFSAIMNAPTIPFYHDSGIKRPIFIKGKRQ